METLFSSNVYFLYFFTSWICPGAPHDTSIDFEAGRFFERADTRGTLDQAEFQRLWRAARSGEPMEPPTKAPAPSSSSSLPPPSSVLDHQSQHPYNNQYTNQYSGTQNHQSQSQSHRWQLSSDPSFGLAGGATAVEPPPPSALPLPADFDAGTRFERFDRYFVSPFLVLSFKYIMQSVHQPTLSICCLYASSG